ncbi:WD repeat-containing protein 87-like [Ostrinia nubilalis]|uniref:WD repeat-containing protein 87-like n=1 Tax=Ostrinia nubilalis TaxID=29057 RepID=UPI00308251ED
MDTESIASTSKLTAAEIIKNAAHEDKKVCPLCGTEVRLYFIHFNEKVLMCGTDECPYPFGVEEVVFAKVDEGSEYNVPVPSVKLSKRSRRSRRSKGSPSASNSRVSTTAWSDIEKMTRVNEAEEQLASQQAEAREFYTHKTKKSPKEVAPKDKTQEKLLKELRKVYTKDMEMTKEDDFIKNEKWLKNLMDLQESSGQTLVKEEEMKMLRSKHPEIGSGELKFDIDMTTATNNISVIKIAIQNKKGEKEGEKKGEKKGEDNGEKKEEDNGEKKEVKSGEKKEEMKEM